MTTTTLPGGTCTLADDLTLTRMGYGAMQLAGPHVFGPPKDRAAGRIVLDDTGVDPAQVDVVINTHIHSDHVCWNTRLIDGAFVPTFPNAIHLVPQDD